MFLDALEGLTAQVAQGSFSRRDVLGVGVGLGMAAVPGSAATTSGLDLRRPEDN